MEIKLFPKGGGGVKNETVWVEFLNLHKIEFSLTKLNYFQPSLFYLSSKILS